MKDKGGGAYPTLIVTMSDRYLEREVMTGVKNPSASNQVHISE